MKRRDEKQKENCARAVFFFPFKGINKIKSVRKNYRGVWMIKRQEDDLSSFFFEYSSLRYK